MLSIQDKYLKYKSKYLKLKNKQKGGGGSGNKNYSIRDMFNILSDQDKIRMIGRSPVLHNHTDLDLKEPYTLRSLLHPFIADKKLIDVFNIVGMVYLENIEDIRLYINLLPHRHQNIKSININYNITPDDLKDFVVISGHIKKLTLSEYNQPLGDMLSSLTELTELTLSQYNQPLGNSLDNLINLQSLLLVSYSDELGESLKKLVNLRIFTSYESEFINLDALENAKQLTELRLSKYYNIEDTLTQFKQLNTLNLERCVVKDEKDAIRVNSILLKLPNLKSLALGGYIDPALYPIIEHNLKLIVG